MSEETDILEEEEEGDGDEWVASIARGVGTAVATMSSMLRNASGALARDLPTPRKRPSKNVDELLHDLGRVVSAHEHNDWKDMRQDPEVWRLIALLSRAPRRLRVNPGMDVARAPAQQIIDADYSEDPNASNQQEERP